MAALDFPASPSDGDIYTASGRSWTYDATIGVWVLSAGAASQIPNSKLADMDQSRIKGRAEGAGTGSPQDLTPAQVKAVLDYLADEVAYDNAGSGLSATEVQAAIDELAGSGLNVKAAFVVQGITYMSGLSTGIASATRLATGKWEVTLNTGVVADVRNALMLGFMVDDGSGASNWRSCGGIDYASWTASKYRVQFTTGNASNSLTNDPDHGVVLIL